jgi:exopolysaccharide production protein ExoY
VDQLATSANETLASPISDVVSSDAATITASTGVFAQRSVAMDFETPAQVFAVASPASDGGNSSRLMDVLFAGALVVLTLPLMMFCALAVLLSGKGPVLFSQKRIGRFGEEFNCLKFRTMIPDAELAIPSILQGSDAVVAEWAATQKLRHDPRITPVGRFLRRYCLDELPQLVNILSGDMSIVGPRPIIAGEVVRYGPYFADYCSVRPGLTGLWQISDRHAISYEDRVRLDATYAKSKSLHTDLRIIWRTVPIVLTGKNM